jgi:hypothetical protein
MRLDEYLVDGERGRFGENVCHRDDRDFLDANFELGERVRRMEFMPPRRARDVEFGLSALGADCDTSQQPVGSLGATGGGATLEQLEVSQFRLIRDHGVSAGGDRVGADVALVGTDVEHHGTVVARFVRLRDEYPFERQPVDEEVVVSERYAALPYRHRVDGPWT